MPQKITQLTDSVVGLLSTKTLTDGCKDVGKTEVIHSIEGQEVVEKLLLLIVTAEEGVSLVQFSERKNKIVGEKCRSKY